MGGRPLVYSARESAGLDMNRIPRLVVAATSTSPHELVHTLTRVTGRRLENAPIKML
jgi:hypothetical protein